MKRKVISFLIGLSIILLLVNILIEVFKTDSDDIIPQDISVVLIDSLFFDVIDEYSLEEEWITKKQLRKNQADSIDYYYNIKIPPDVPSPSLLKDVIQRINWPAIKIISEESVNFGDSDLKIYSNGVLKLWAKFNYVKTIVRPFSQLAFIIENADDMSKEDFQKFIKIPFPFALEIIPSKDSEQNKISIKEYNKEYALLLNDDIDESMYRLSPDLSKGLLKGSVGAIANSFSDAVYFIVDDNSDLYRSTVFNYIRDEFRKKGIVLQTRASFVKMNMASKEEMISLFKFYYTSSKSKQGKAFLINSSGFIELQNEIEIAKKKGHKFILPSEINKPK